jgi:SAM-dependent methyltransferase
MRLTPRPPSSRPRGLPTRRSTSHKPTPAALPVEAGASDLVVSFMVLMNVDDLGGVVHEAARVLERGGRFCIAITHPFNTAGDFETTEPDSAFVIRESYFEPHRKDLLAERGGLAMSFVDLHRPLQDYADSLEQAGFVVERIREIGNDEEARQRASQLRLPLFLHGTRREVVTRDSSRAPTWQLRGNHVHVLQTMFLGAPARRWATSASGSRSTSSSNADIG